IEDPPALAGLHSRNDILHGEPWPPQIHLRMMLQLAQSPLVNGLECQLRGIVDEDVDWTERLFGPVYQRRAATLGIAQVAGHHDARPADLLDAIHSLPEAVLGASRNGELCTLRREPDCYGTPGSAFAGACHKRHPSVATTHRSVPFRCVFNSRQAYAGALQWR